MLPTLPAEIQKEILDKACMKRSNHKESCYVVVVVSTDSTASECKDEVTRWLLQSLDRTEVEKDLWRIIVGIKDNDWIDPEANNQVMNTLYFALFINDETKTSIDEDSENLISDSDTGTQSINADDILVQLYTEPVCVTKIGVSAIREEKFVCVWDKMISEVPDGFDAAGEGYMHHPMWVNWNGWWTTVREQSCNYGWGKYRLNNSNVSP